MPKVSVILPVYNAERFIEKTITTLMHQTLNDVEFIVIDDGSTDDSFNIINHTINCYPQRKHQVNLIHRDNRGVAETRSEGILLAQGDYITFIDSDDWVEPDWLELMYNKAVDDNSDIVVCNYFREDANNTVTVNQEVSNCSDECIANLLLDKISNCNWNKLVSRALFLENKILFDKKYSLGEDFLVTLKVFISAKKISLIRKPLYHYNLTNLSSLAKNTSTESLEGLLGVVKDTNIILSEKGKGSKFNYELGHFKNKVRNIFIMQSIGNPQRKEKALQLFNESNHLITLGSAPKALWIIYNMKKLHITFLYKLFDFMLIMNERLKYGR
ncbi:glycosyltransferase family 2 protein [Plesiomonas shigelloides]|uniref:glycosyltransferase family 2 protein n=1 Tax=Plesiomonas shigelloides TaxID=703 RepID=UPI002246C00F|nr:glycosyltransferase family 2 protein [Plesiomonas shigelloides]MCX2534401.1 glycosyltransferase family 2 protein [Plesiomonas shigelloides]